MNKDGLLLELQVLLSHWLSPWAHYPLACPGLCSASPLICSWSQIDERSSRRISRTCSGQTDFKSQDSILIKDPDHPRQGYALVSLMSAACGPNDLLGFRNRSIPHSARIVAVGDSQTYGNNAGIEERNWPGFMLVRAEVRGAQLYTICRLVAGPLRNTSICSGRRWHSSLK